jgi:hypothetical protein
LCKHYWSSRYIGIIFQGGCASIIGPQAAHIGIIFQSGCASIIGPRQDADAAADEQLGPGEQEGSSTPIDGGAVESSDEEIFVFSCVLFNRHDEIFAYSILVTCVWLHPMQVVAFLVKRPHIVKWVHSYIWI